MSQPTYCHCTHCGRESNPVWARKYDGLCLDCYNAGVGDFLDRIAALEAKLAEAVELLRPFAVIGGRNQDEQNAYDFTLEYEAFVADTRADLAAVRKVVG